MAENYNTNTSDKETSKRVFVTHAKVLSDEQRQTLTDEEKAFEATCQDRDDDGLSSLINAVVRTMTRPNETNFFVR